MKKLLLLTLAVSFSALAMRTTVVPDVNLGTAVTSLTGISPIVATGVGSVTVSVTTASTSTSGILTAANWNTFNGKADGANYVAKIGDTMSGALNIGADVNPQNVDLNISGGKYKIGGANVISVGTGVGANNVLVGGGGSAITSGTGNTIVGRGSGNTQTTASENTIVGSGSGTQVTAGENVIVGTAAGTQLTSGTRNIIIGDEAGGIGGPDTGSNNILIGRGARHSAIGVNSSIVMGSVALATASNQAVIGSGSTQISNVFFGNGVTASSPGSYVINGSGGSGTDIAGGNVTIAGGKGTGTGAGGSVIISIATSAGSTGSGLNNITERARFDSNGLSILPKTTGAGNTGEVRFLELAANGSNYVGLKADDLLSGNLTWTLPATDGSSGDVLKTNGSATLSFSSPGSLPYTPTTSSDWNGAAPTTIQQALDRIAACIKSGTCAGAGP